MVQDFFHSLIGARCPVCRHVVPRLRDGFCPLCREELAVMERFDAHPLISRLRLSATSALPVLSLGWYEGAWRDFILAGKRDPSPLLAAPLAGLLARRCPRAWRALGLVPIPASSWRTPHLVEEVTHRLHSRHDFRHHGPGSELRLPLTPIVAQKTHSASERLTQGERFQWQNTAGPGALLLLDDVITTGSTLASAARTLEAAGMGPFFALTLAVTPARGRHRSPLLDSPFHH